MDMKKCESCGNLMFKTSDFGAGKTNNRYCTHCTYPTGELMARHLVHANMVKYYMTMRRLSREDAIKYVDEYMAGMPAWQ